MFQSILSVIFIAAGKISISLMVYGFLLLLLSNKP